MIHYNGMNVVISDMIPKGEIQFRFPKTKRKRIRKKFAKNKQNFKECDQMIIFGDKLLMSQKHWDMVQTVVPSA